MDCSLPGSSVYGLSQARNTGVDCHFFPSPGTFLTLGSNPHLLHWHADSWPLIHHGSPYVRGLTSKSLKEDAAKLSKGLGLNIGTECRLLCFIGYSVRVEKRGLHRMWTAEGQFIGAHSSNRLPHFSSNVNIWLPLQYKRIFTYYFHCYLLSMCPVPGLAVGTGDTQLNKMHKILALMEHTSGN